ncbi:alpha/beta fold hydrolase [Bradyrhizobium canariense]|uniref:Pimeloyl-ACP methyl ester carboxylesterase n=1 Tax=Bradyrhizobium canariense TaxID=255045 RepID=A0A1H1M1N6_9BRAD|nr:alpha/beta hydrolase [Bradyrhizobium canariense]SDR80724.1 Pimeloyl-ACP methyl ester carboxylesterase [Bradyrhizobium canariense]
MRNLILAAAAGLITVGSAGAQQLSSTSATTTYHTLQVDGLNLFYREAGPKDAPTLLLLHGFPSSSRMFETLIPLLADRYHLVAPDYPGFGLSDAPPPSQYAYTFDHIASTVDHFTEALGLKSYSLFLQDYGGPVGFRIATAHPDRVKAIVIQNAVASEDGLGQAWDERKAYWRDREANEQKVISNFLSLATTKLRHVGTSPNVDRYDPSSWNDEFAHLSQARQRRIQADLFFDYQTNVASYPKWQAWMREHQPPMLVVWGKYDPSFAVGGAAAYQRDVPKAEVHILDAGHFALDEKLDDIASLMRAFLGRQQLGQK